MDDNDKYVEKYIEDLKCCGNCGTFLNCKDSEQEKNVCSIWIYDGKTKEERLK